MSSITKAQLQQAREEGYAHGFAVGVESGKRAADKTQASLDAKIKLMNAVGQALQTQSALVQGLASAFDCGPR